ncbi:hypothetical protein [Pseudoxanthomonas suwonensis]|uniref:hypothetical protein n=1 Tax=Pseudoxanthomonas suwonensis TaxID=314722 RepID=UPI00138F07BA|nr:hypothetical protein [Pseudoxanthomonas suwonensis]KAF1704454.1 hypothetical protein CSC68_02655 [Pseudoxanthomonas suwonensis]
MQATVGSPWSPRQRYWLQALGCSVLRVAGAEEELAAPAPGADEVAQAAPPQVRQVAPADRDIAPPRRRAPVASEPAAGGATPAPTVAGRHGAMRRPAGLPDRLELAVLRASGLAPTDPRVQALLAEWPGERLRADPAAKRQLWPLLRALRRPA